MMIPTIDRKTWLESFDAENTKKNVISAMIQFDKFLTKRQTNESEVMEFLKKSDEMETYFMLRDICTFLQTQVRTNTARLYFNYIKAWVRENRVFIDEKRLSNYLKWKRELKERKYTPDEKTLNKVILNAKKNYQSFFLFLMSTGCRQGEALQLKVKNIDDSTLPAKILFEAETTKTGQERIGFLTNEAYNAIKYRLDADPEDLVFSDINASSLQKQMKRIRRDIEMDDRFSTNRAKLTPHRFRAHYKKIMDRTISSDFSHFMLGHSGALVTYDGDHDEGVRDDFLKAEKALTVDLGNRLKEERRKNDDLAERVKQIEEKLRRDLT